MPRTYALESECERMKYRIQITDEANRSAGTVFLDFHDDAAAIHFVDKIARTDRRSQIELSVGTRVVKRHPALQLVKGDAAAD